MKLSIKKYLPSIAYRLTQSLLSVLLFAVMGVACHRIIWVPKAKRAEVARILNA
jgi:hypothetical protein